MTPTCRHGVWSQEIRAAVAEPATVLDVDCTGCTWTLPPVWLRGHEDEIRAAKAATTGRLFAAVRQHTGYTGHTARWTHTVHTPPDQVVQSWTTFAPVRRG